jgi:hypothetical protein
VVKNKTILPENQLPRQKEGQDRQQLLV